MFKKFKYFLHDEYLQNLKYNLKDLFSFCLLVFNYKFNTICCNNRCEYFYLYINFLNFFNFN